MTDFVSESTLKRIEAELAAEFQSLVDGMILDPEFEYEIDSVEAVERCSTFPTDVDVLFLLNVTTNNRAQLLGQATPFEQGDYKGFYNNLYGGWLTKHLQDKFTLDFRYYVDVNAVPTADHCEQFDREIPLETALRENIVREDGRLVEKMNEYGLDSLVLGGGTLVAGPQPAPIETIERLFNKYDIDAVLDLFCGSGAFAKVALQRGASAVTCLDLDLTSARENLRECREGVHFEEGDAFDFTPDRHYDLALVDPYFHLLPEFIDEQYSTLSTAADMILVTAGFRGDHYWIETVRDDIERYSTDTEVIDTGRTVQILSHHGE